MCNQLMLSFINPSGSNQILVYHLFQFFHKTQFQYYTSPFQIVFSTYWCFILSEVQGLMVIFSSLGYTGPIQLLLLILDITSKQANNLFVYGQTLSEIWVACTLVYPFIQAAEKEMPSTFRKGATGYRRAHTQEIFRILDMTISACYLFTACITAFVYKSQHRQHRQ